MWGAGALIILPCMGRNPFEVGQVSTQVNDDLMNKKS